MASNAAENTLDAARAGDERAFARLVAPFERELRAHCYRMCGALREAEDLFQESMLRAWKGLDGFEGRASVRTWLYKIATNVCLNALEARKARLMPMDRAPAGNASQPMVAQLEPIWLEPFPESLYADPEPSPEARYAGRQSVALAFMAALQLLPARQRAVLLLHDVLGWKASECATLLETSVAAVNSTLQRARETLDVRSDGWRAEPDALDDDDRKLLHRYVRAWETADLSALVALLHEEATLSMPPIPVWLCGVRDLEASMQAMVFSFSKPGDFRVVETRANGRPALALYRREGDASDARPFALQLLEWKDGRLRAIVAFLDTTLFAAFGLPETI